MLKSAVVKRFSGHLSALVTLLSLVSIPAWGQGTELLLSMNRQLIQRRDIGVEQMGPLIGRRAAMLSDLLQRDPARAISLGLPKEVQAQLRARLPERSDQIESTGDWEGAAE